MDEYMDIIGLSMNGTDKKNFCTAESIIQDEQAIHSLESNLLIMKQEELGKESCLSSSQGNYSTSDIKSTNKGINLFHLTYTGLAISTT